MDNNLDLLSISDEFSDLGIVRSPESSRIDFKYASLGFNSAPMAGMDYSSPSVRM